MIAISTQLNRVHFRTLWQEYYPFVAGIAAAFLVIAYGDWIGHIIIDNDVKLGNLYTAVAGIFAVITGFLATFYGSVQSISDTRLNRISKTRVFLRFIRYIKIATKWGLLVSTISIPFIVFEPSTDTSWISTISVAAWCGACVFGFASFARVAGLLFFIFEYKPPEDDGAH
jgi:hypothetical protein